MTTVTVQKLRKISQAVHCVVRSILLTTKAVEYIKNDSEQFHPNTLQETGNQLSTKNGMEINWTRPKLLKNKESLMLKLSKTINMPNEALLIRTSIIMLAT